MNELGGYVLQPFSGSLHENMKEAPVWKETENVQPSFWDVKPSNHRITLNSAVSFMSPSHQNTDISPNQTVQPFQGVSSGCTERLQRGRCRRVCSPSEEGQKESVSCWLIWHGKGQKVEVETLVGTACLSHSTAGTVCADGVYFQHSPHPTRLFVWFILLSCDGSFKVPSGGCLCRLIRGAAVMWYERPPPSSKDAGRLTQICRAYKANQSNKWVQGVCVKVLMLGKLACLVHDKGNH